MAHRNFEVNGYKLNLFEISIIGELRKAYPGTKSLRQLAGNRGDKEKVSYWLDQLVRRNIIERYNETYRYALKVKSNQFY